MPKLDRPTVILVDDDPLILESLKRLLASEYEVQAFERAELAMESVRQQLQPVAAIVCDMYMPGMDGLNLASRVHQFSPETVSLLLTGSGDPHLPVRALNEGKVFQFVQKPCPSDEMKRLLKLAAREHQRRLLQKSYTWRITFNKGRPSEVSLGPGVYSVTGYRAGDFQDQPSLWKSILWPDDAPTVEAYLLSVQQHRPVDTAEFRIRRKDMRCRWLRMTVLSRQGDPDAPCPSAEGFLEDITEQKEKKIALQDANRRYERMVTNVPGLVFHARLDTDGILRFTFVSPTCRQLFDLEPDDICADAELLLKSFMPDDRAGLYKLIAESAESLQPFTWQGGTLKNECRRWFQATARPERLDDGQVLWDGVMIDITALKEAERKACFLAQLSSDNPDPVLRVRQDGTILFANPAGSTLLELWDRSVGQQVPEEVMESVHQVLRSGLVTSETVLCRERCFSILFAPVSGCQEVNLYARDITITKNAELELIDANQKLVDHDKLKSEFVSTITHELRTPLCIFKNIISNALAGVTGPIGPKLRENLEMAHQSVERLTRIISNFMDISEIDAGKIKLNRKITLVQALIKDTVDSMRPLAQAKKISLALNLPRTNVFADIDQERIAKVLENIVGNAIKFIPLKGSIYVTLTDYLQGEFFDICVRDNGPGMTRKEAGMIFDRFVQAKVLKGPGEHGTGLGLSIAKEIVSLHGGQIWVETEPKNGCAFYFRLPKTDSVAVTAVANTTNTVDIWK
jgi:signal transduction histidine kinase/CheY-like chemotaxis protein